MIKMERYTESPFWKMIGPEIKTVRALAETEKRKVLIVVITSEGDGISVSSNVSFPTTRRLLYVLRSAGC